MECPKCHRWIVEGSLNHSYCGWGFQVEAPKCCHEGCNNEAVVRVGAAKECLYHYEERFQKQAESFCASKGLYTVAQIKEYLKAKYQHVLPEAIFREPGQDEGEH